MIAIRDAIGSAFTTLKGLVEGAEELELEEVLLSEDEKAWRITVSYLLPVPENEVILQKSPVLLQRLQVGYEPLGRVDENRPLRVRRYKTLEFDRDSGDFRQMVTRVFSAP